MKAVGSVVPKIKVALDRRNSSIRAFQVRHPKQGTNIKAAHKENFNGSGCP
jgi:hypothetical protein